MSVNSSTYSYSPTKARTPSSLSSLDYTEALEGPSVEASKPTGRASVNSPGSREGILKKGDRCATTHRRSVTFASTGSTNDAKSSITGYQSRFSPTSDASFIAPDTTLDELALSMGFRRKSGGPESMILKTEDGEESQITDPFPTTQFTSTADSPRSPTGHTHSVLSDSSSSDGNIILTPNNSASGSSEDVCEDANTDLPDSSRPSSPSAWERFQSGMTSATRKLGGFLKDQYDQTFAHSGDSHRSPSYLSTTQLRQTSSSPPSRSGTTSRKEDEYLINTFVTDKQQPLPPGVDTEGRVRDAMETASKDLSTWLKSKKWVDREIYIQSMQDFYSTRQKVMSENLAKLEGNKTKQPNVRSDRGSYNLPSVSTQAPSRSTRSSSQSYHTQGGSNEASDLPGRTTEKSSRQPSRTDAWLNEIYNTRRITRSRTNHRSPHHSTRRSSRTHHRSSFRPSSYTGRRQSDVYSSFVEPSGYSRARRPRSSRYLETSYRSRSRRRRSTYATSHRVNKSRRYGRESTYHQSRPSRNGTSLYDDSTEFTRRERYAKKERQAVLSRRKGMSSEMQSRLSRHFDDEYFAL